MCKCVWKRFTPDYGNLIPLIRQFKLNFARYYFKVFSQEICGVPFFYKSATSLTGTSSEQTQSKLTNVANLRNKQKSSRIVENVKLNDEDDDFFKEVDDDLTESNMTDTQNEALPSLVQKKIGKILQKLQFISSVRDSVNVGRNAKITNDNNSTSDFDEIERDLDDVDLDDDSSQESNENKNSTSGFNVTSIGIFLAELVGTAVGLLIGAAAQFTNGQRQ